MARATPDYSSKPTFRTALTLLERISEFSRVRDCRGAADPSDALRSSDTKIDASCSLAGFIDLAAACREETCNAVADAPRKVIECHDFTPRRPQAAPAGSGIAVESQTTLSYRMVIGDRKNRNQDQLFGGSVSKFHGKT